MRETPSYYRFSVALRHRRVKHALARPHYLRVYDSYIGVRTSNTPRDIISLDTGNVTLTFDHGDPITVPIQSAEFFAEPDHDHPLGYRVSKIRYRYGLLCYVHLATPDFSYDIKPTFKDNVR